MNGEPADRPDPRLIATAADFPQALRDFASPGPPAPSARLPPGSTSGAPDPVSPSTLGGWFSGRHLPAPALTRSGTVAMLLAVCGETDPTRHKHWLTALHRVRRGPGNTKHPATPLRTPMSTPYGYLRELPGAVLAILAPDDARASPGVRPGPFARQPHAHRGPASTWSGWTPPSHRRGTVRGGRHASSDPGQTIESRSATGQGNAADRATAGQRLLDIPRGVGIGARAPAWRANLSRLHERSTGVRSPISGGGRPYGLCTDHAGVLSPGGIRFHGQVVAERLWCGLAHGRRGRDPVS